MSSILGNSRLSRRTTRSLLVGTIGVAHAIVVLAIRAAIAIPQNPDFLVWAFVGATVVGVVFAYLAVERHLYAPAIATLGIFVVAAHATWRYYASLNGALPGTFPQPLFLYVSFWPLVVLFEGIVATLEWGLKRGVAVLLDSNPS